MTTPAHERRGARVPTRSSVINCYRRCRCCAAIYFFTSTANTVCRVRIKNRTRFREVTVQRDGADNGKRFRRAPSVRSQRFTGHGNRSRENESSVSARSVRDAFSRTVARRPAHRTLPPSRP
jgi:hypothetical protein